MTTVASGGSYAPQSSGLLRELDGFLSSSRAILVEHFGEEGASAVHSGALEEYERLVPQLPYIGGKDNTLLTNLFRAAWGLAIYRVVQRRGGTVEEAGEVIHTSMEAMLNRIPGLLRYLMGWVQLSRWTARRGKQAALQSQERKYPGDWVFEIVEGDGRTFERGMDYLECAIVKFMDAQGAEELTPYLCNTDYVAYGAFGIVLRRTKTLAWGCDRCDFRMTRGGDPPKAWPPTFPERHCGQPLG